jgi:hypothetical protein
MNKETEGFNFGDPRQDEFRVLISDGWGFLSDEQGILEFYSEQNARNYLKIAPIDTDRLRLVTRAIENGSYSTSLPQLDEGTPY